MRGLDIICPVFREEELIRRFHDKLVASLAPLADRYSLKIIYVLDPSPDRTEAVLADIARADPRVDVLVMSRRFGHQAALLAGMHPRPRRRRRDAGQRSAASPGTDPRTGAALGRGRRYRADLAPGRG